MKRGGSELPCATLSNAPILRSAIFFSSKTSTARPASFAMASAFSARTRGVSLFEGSFTRSRVKFCDSAMMRPRAIPLCIATVSASGNPTRETDSIFFLSFLSVLYLSVSKSPVSKPSTIACEPSSGGSVPPARNAKFFTDFAFRDRSAAPANLRSVATLN